MPNLTGEFLTKILRCIGYQGLIIGITGNGLEEDVKQFLDNGADYIFIKPFTKRKLDKLLDFTKNKCIHK
jgi:DNA-binding response OmpR family regulator